MVGISQSRAELSRAKTEREREESYFSLKGDPDGVIKREEWKCSESLVTMMPLLAIRITSSSSSFFSFYLFISYYSIK